MIAFLLGAARSPLAWAGLAVIAAFFYGRHVQAQVDDAAGLRAQLAAERELAAELDRRASVYETVIVDLRIDLDKLTAEKASADTGLEAFAAEIARLTAAAAAAGGEVRACTNSQEDADAINR